MNALNRNCDIVGMANFAPTINTRGCIYTYQDGLVLRSTYHVLYLYTNYLGDVVRNAHCQDGKQISVLNRGGAKEIVDEVDVCVTEFSDRPGMSIALVNKSPDDFSEVQLEFEAQGEVKGFYICGETTSSYNDIGRTEVEIQAEALGTFRQGMNIRLRPHSVEIIRIGC